MVERYAHAVPDAVALRRVAMPGSNELIDSLLIIVKKMN